MYSISLQLLTYNFIMVVETFYLFTGILTILGNLGLSSMNIGCKKWRQRFCCEHNKNSELSSPSRGDKKMTV